jgi:sterol desaturase/sphingolipid hydroxylase (fatty acid hydroxylase superfamily)
MSMESIFAQFSNAGIDLFRLLIWLVLIFAVLTPLELLWPARRKKLFRKGWTTDLGYYFVNNYIPSIIILPGLAVLGWALHSLVPQSFYGFMGDLPLLARLGIALVAGEIGYYWAHRLSHETPLLWRFHAVHHSAEELDWMVSSRGHPLDVAFSHFCGLAPIYALGLVQPTPQNPDIVSILFVIFGRIWGFLIHANVRGRIPGFQHILSTPGFHQWHHTKTDHVDRNYASILSCLDVIFGTFYLPKEPPAEYGISSPMPNDLIGQLAEPFAPRRSETDLRPIG